MPLCTATHEARVSPNTLTVRSRIAFAKKSNAPLALSKVFLRHVHASRSQLYSGLVSCCHLSPNTQSTNSIHLPSLSPFAMCYQLSNQSNQYKKIRSLPGVSLASNSLLRHASQLSASTGGEDVRSADRYHPRGGRTLFLLRTAGARRFTPLWRASKKLCYSVTPTYR